MTLTLRSLSWKGVTLAKTLDQYLTTVQVSKESKNGLDNMGL